MKQGGAKPGSSVGGEARWRAAAELLEARQYEQAANLLREAQLVSQQSGDAVLADILAAACRICLACDQCRAEVERHQRGRDEADQRERELRRQLGAILDHVSRGEAPATQGRPEAPPPDPATGRRLPVPGEHPGLWQRIQVILRRGPRPRPPDRHGPVPPANEKGRAPFAPPAEEAQPPSTSPDAIEEVPETPSLVVYCLGPFRVYQDDELISDWPSGKGKCIFKYMIANYGRSTPKEVLMDLFWRGADPEAARNNLNVAIYGLREAFRAARPDFSHILFRDDCYLLNPAMAVWADVEEFVQRYESGQSLEKRGELTEAIREYEVAEGLYQGDFLVEDLYEDWPLFRRERLKDSYLIILDRLSRYYLEEQRHTLCIHLCQKILATDDCREDAHRRLMRCYSRQGQRNLALRQYHLCVETLARVLEVSPMQETRALYGRIRNGDTV